MSSSKLSDAQKQEIVQIYQETPEETTITLAERYGVSSSTVRRILQGAIPKELYDSLTQQKQRLHRTGKRSARKAKAAATSTPILTLETQSEPIPSPPEIEADSQSEVESHEPSTPQLSEPNISRSSKRRRKRSSAAEATTTETTEDSLLDSPEVEQPTVAKKIIPSPQTTSRQPILKPDAQQLTLEDFFSSSEDLSEFEEDDDDEDYLEEDELEVDGNTSNELLILKEQISSQSNADKIQILPLSEANLPRTCYLVIDRFSELITRPLKAFSELGQIPAEEIQKKTLPIFDNHRVASRFSARNQRVFKVPDSQLLQKTASYLQAKGITRLFIDGQVYRF
ncbi:MAG: transcriptional regulator [Microcoleaceae cyanobacterium]